ncbi:MAG: antibiotic biosynthesis monooxygenase family protein [Chloroflexota bacterium]
MESVRSMGVAVAPGQCVRIVPARVRPGMVDDYLAAHRVHHTPAVRRQPGFVAKLILQAEDDPERLVMVLIWETSDQALAWVRLPEHDAAGEPFRDLVVRGDASAAAARGGYRVVDLAIGPG